MPLTNNPLFLTKTIEQYKSSLIKLRDKRKSKISTVVHQEDETLTTLNDLDAVFVLHIFMQRADETTRIIDFLRNTLSQREFNYFESFCEKRYSDALDINLFIESVGALAHGLINEKILNYELKSMSCVHISMALFLFSVTFIVIGMNTIGVMGFLPMIVFAVLSIASIMASIFFYHQGCALTRESKIKLKDDHDVVRLDLRWNYFLSSYRFPFAMWMHQSFIKKLTNKKFTALKLNQHATSQMTLEIDGDQLTVLDDALRPPKWITTVYQIPGINDSVCKIYTTSQNKVVSKIACNIFGLFHTCPSGGSIPTRNHEAIPLTLSAEVTGETLLVDKTFGKSHQSDTI